MPENLRSFSVTEAHGQKKGGAEKEAKKAQKRNMGVGLLGVGFVFYVASKLLAGNQDAQFFTYVLSHFLIPFGLFLVALSFIG